MPTTQATNGPADALARRVMAGKAYRAWQRTIAFVKRNRPGDVAYVVKQADAAAAGRLVLPGTGGKPFAVGDPPRWSANPVRDSEYVWGLNRHGHWLPMLRAFALTGERKYGQRVRTELLDWVAQCPPPPVQGNEHSGVWNAATPWRTLEAGIRMYSSWPVALYALAGTELFDDELASAMTQSVRQHGEVLATIPPVLWPRADHNHYLMENLGLLQLSVLYPDLPSAAAWREQALRELGRCAAAQVTEDGGQIEGCPSYHNNCVADFFHAIRIARDNDLAVPEPMQQRVGRMLDFSMHTLRPSGTGVPWGDSDADANAVRTAAIGFDGLGDDSGLRVVQRVLGEQGAREACARFVWDLADAEALVEKLKRSLGDVTLPRVQRFKSLDQVALRSGWEGNALSVFFACRTPVYNGHAHIDPNAFDFTALGRPLLIDPGRFTYREDADRRRYKSATSHNCVTVNGAEPFAYVSTWNFGPQSPGQIVWTQDEPGLQAVAGEHCNLHPATHQRVVALLGGEALLVLDRLSGLGPQDSVQIYYHFDAPDLAWDAATRQARTNTNGIEFRGVIAGALAGEVLPGNVSDKLDVQRPSRRLRLENKTGPSDRCFGGLFVPTRRDGAKPAAIELILEPQAGGVVCRTGGITGNPAYQWTTTGLKKL